MSDTTDTTRVEWTDFDFEVFKNFSRMNPNICFNEEELSVVHAKRNVLARWKGFNQFPCEFCVDDAGKIINAMNALNTRGFDVIQGDRRVIKIERTEGFRGKFEFRASDPIHMKNKKTRFRPGTLEKRLEPQPTAIFEISTDMIKEIKKSAQILGFEDIILELGNNRLGISIVQATARKISNTASFEVPINYGGEVVEYPLNITQFDIIDGLYRVRAFFSNVRGNKTRNMIFSHLRKDESDMQTESGLDYLLMSGSKTARAKK